MKATPPEKPPGFSESEILAEAIRRDDELRRGEVKALSEAEFRASLIRVTPDKGRPQHHGSSH